MSGQVDTRLYVTAQPYAVVWGCIFSYASACLSTRLIARYIARAYGSETGLYEYKIQMEPGSFVLLLSDSLLQNHTS
ncbi:hypothetical protein OH76DRAFT_681770 [Lentinus brumalis]|uniref:Uncharacterized protein n=1 Tax=Lentinus brumalis TaxID=2498619 RepID=A0A371D6R7_9APHY|nr:hypothetical protein OH76DRAFT_681770 [Polyporus brumalis]